MRALAVACAAALFVAQSGCARHVPHWRLPEPPSEQLRRSIGRIAVVVDDAWTRFPSPPVAGACSMAALGALGGMGVGLVIGMTVCGGVRGVNGGGWAGALIVGFVLAVGLALTAVAVPLGGLIGGLGGASKGRSGEEIERGRRILELAAIRAGLSNLLRAGILAEVTRETRLKIVDPATADAILLIEFPTTGLAGPRAVDPPLRAFGEVRFRLLRASDRRPLHALTLGFRGGERSFDLWIANEGILFQQDLVRGVSRLPDRLVEELFLLERTP
jgi:hypothetical protein